MVVMVAPGPLVDLGIERRREVLPEEETLEIEKVRQMEEIEETREAVVETEQTEEVEEEEMEETEEMEAIADKVEIEEIKEEKRYSVKSEILSDHIQALRNIFDN